MKVTDTARLFMAMLILAGYPTADGKVEETCGDPSATNATALLQAPHVGAIAALQEEPTEDALLTEDVEEPVASADEFVMSSG
mmetsp:Transcript_50802/g.95007  ORF Transcript_50802/g.95007 Transcript_50802/m.95007 type:complete len:83 (-) Transcript_50802:216-464(-)